MNNGRDFYDLLEDMMDAEDLLQSSAEDTEETYKRVLKKLNMKDDRKVKYMRRFSIKAVAIAAALTVFTVTAFAAYFNITDIFPHVFNEKDASGNIVPVEANLPVLEKASGLVNETATDNNLKVTVRGVAGDSDTLYLAVDVETLDGSPLRASGYENEPQGQLRFEQAFLKFETDGDGLDRQYCATDRIDDGSDLSKATFLINEKTVVENIEGKKVKLILDDLTEYAGGTPREIGQGKSLHDICKDMNVAGDDGYEVENINDEEKYFIRAGQHKAEIDSTLPGLTVDAIGFRDGGMHLGIGGASEYRGIIDGMAVKRLSTEEVVYWDGGSTYEDHAAYFFPGIKSVDELDDYVFVRDASKAFHPVNDGKWEFEFVLNYEDTTAVYSLDGVISVDGKELQVSEITVSPVSVNIKATGDVTDEFMAGTVGVDGKVSEMQVKLADGTVVDSGDRMGMNFDGQSINLSYILPVVIDNSDVVSVVVAGNEIKLK